MKIPIFLFIFVVLFCQFFENSYGQINDSNKYTPKIFLQIRLYDKDGHLYGYVQPTTQVFYMDKAIAWMKKYATNSTIVFNGHAYQLMKYEDSFTATDFHQYGAYFLNLPVDGKERSIVYAWHNSYLMETGDVAKVYWEILVPLH